MDSYVKHTTLALLGCLALTGCIRDDIGACPTLSVQLNIKDRLYANAQEVGYDDPLAGATQFKALVPTLQYTLRDASTGEIVRVAPLGPVDHSGESHRIDFDEALPYGRYTLTVWGGTEQASEVGDDPTTCDLTGLSHPLFVSNQTIDFDYESAPVVSSLERGNGLVIVETLWDTFPSGINAADETFSGLTRTLHSELTYSGEQEMTLSHSLTTATEMETRSILPPSVKEGGTKLKIRFFDANDPAQPGITPEPISLTVRRNQVTRLKLSYSLYSKSVAIDMMVNGQWQRINGMKVD